MTYIYIKNEVIQLIWASHTIISRAKLNCKKCCPKNQNETGLLTEYDGIKERVNLITAYIPEISVTKLVAMSKSMKRNTDDIIDAIILAITANISAQGYYELLPQNPMQDETGLLTQMIIPCFD